MHYILDTHVWVWVILDPAKLPKRVRLLLDDRSRYDRLYVSSISLWEVCKLVQKGRLQLLSSPDRWLKEALRMPRLSVQDFTVDIALESTMLPQPFHKDPADQIIVATTRVLNAILITADRELQSYPHVRTFW